MQDLQILLRIRQLVQIQNIAVLQTDIIRFIEETLLLHTGHIQDIQLRHYLIHLSHFRIADSLVIQILIYVVRNLQFLRRDQDKVGSFI